MKKFICLLALMLLVLLPTYASAIELPEMIRVGLYFGSSSLQEVKVSAEGGVSVYQGEADLGWYPEPSVTLDQGVWTISGGEQPITATGDKLTLVSAGGNLIINGKQYRGEFELVPNGDKITVVNHIGLEEYLYGVVPLEMSTGWHIEALKAQAVCARTYAVKSMGKYMSQGFDVYNTTMSQVYGGASVEKEDCTKAVDDTKGIVITYNDALIDAVYFSTSTNSHTFSNIYVWGSDTPYLKGVEDTYQHIVRPDCSAWEKTFTLSELQNILDNKDINIGTLKDLEIDEMSPEGAVVSLTFKGTDGEYTVTKDRARTFLNLRSQGYSLQKNGGEVKVSVLSGKGVSTSSETLVLGKDGALGELSYILDKNNKPTEIKKTDIKSVKLKGTGYGHGLGMSQYGAYGMAKSGFTYDEIIKHYYTGVELTETE